MASVWLLFLLPVLLEVSAERKNYEGYMEVEISIRHHSHQPLLQEMELHGELDILRMPKFDRNGLILVSPEMAHVVGDSFVRSGINATVVNENIQDIIDQQYKAIDARYKEDPYSFDKNDFNKLDALMKQLDVWVSQCPSGLECSLYSIGKSYQGRDQKVIKIRKVGSSNKVIWLEFTTHSREWLSTSTGQNTIDHLIRDYATDSEVKEIVDNFDLHILLVANPDGYVHTHNGYRMWRKTLKPNPGSPCGGTDINRNFDSHWSKQGTSNDPCSDIFHGSKVASEVETRNIQNQVLKLAAGSNMAVFFDVHCCADMWMFPYSYRENYSPWTKCVLTKDHDALQQVADAAVDAIQKMNGKRRWKAGTICQVIYPATGDTVGFAYDNKVKYSYGVELNGRFIADKSTINPVYKDFWTGFVTTLKERKNIEGSH